MGGAVSARRTEYGKAGAGELPAPAFPKRNGRDVSVPLRLVEAPGPLDVLGDLREGFPRFHLAGAALGQVAQGDHSHHLARLQHRESAHLLHRHHPGGLRRVVVRGDHGTVPGHDVLDLDLVGVLLRGDAPGHDVPVGDDAPQVLSYYITHKMSPRNWGSFATLRLFSA